MSLALLPCLTAAGFCFLGVSETNHQYWLLHSVWHIAIEFSICLVLMSALHHPVLSELRCLNPQPQLSVPEGPNPLVLPSRSLSEALAMSDEAQSGRLPCAAAAAATVPLSQAFWNALQHHQSRLTALHLDSYTQARDSSTLSAPPPQPLPAREILSPCWPDRSFPIVPRSASHTNMHHLLPAYVSLLLQQYSTHMKRHRNASQMQQQQCSQIVTGLPSPTEGDTGIVRIGDAAAVVSPEALRLPSGSGSESSVSPSTALMRLDFSKEGNCLWCLSKGALQECEMLKLHEQRLLWVFRLRLLPFLSCCLMPKWLWNPIETHVGRMQRQVDAADEALLLCS